ncbi:MAG: hypothetical protein QM747_16395 [Nocardioides sp.]
MPTTAYDSLPQGIPPAGHVVRTASMATQATAHQAGAPGSRRRGTSAAPSTPYQTVWVRERPSHGTVPTTCSHHRRLTWKAAPNTSPGTHACRSGRPSVTT